MLLIALLILYGVCWVILLLHVDQFCIQQVLFVTLCGAMGSKELKKKQIMDGQ